MVWDVTGRQYAADADTIQIPPAMNVYGTVTAAVLSVTKNAPAAAAFVDFLSSEQGRAILRQAGFSVEPPLQTDATKGE
jgi:ABC-type molybdate transport system substrate-binding protein